MYRIVICDDDKEYIEELKQMILEENKEEREIIFEEYLTGTELLKRVSDDTDVLFLDIQMKGIDGNQTAKLLREKQFQGILVQCSGVFNPTPETIVISPYRYLLKQDSRKDTLAVIGEILEEADRKKQCFILDAYFRREKIMLKITDVEYFTRYRGGSEIHLLPGKREQYSGGTVYSSDTLDELQEKLASSGFAMPHNSFLVNMKYLKDYDVKTGRVDLTEERLFISRSKKKEFMDQVMRYMKTKYKDRNDEI